MARIAKGIGFVPTAPKGIVFSIPYILFCTTVSPLYVSPLSDTYLLMFLSDGKLITAKICPEVHFHFQAPGEQCVGVR